METRFHVHFYIEFVFIYVPGNRDKEIIDKREKEVRVTSRISAVTASLNILRVIEGFSNRYASRFFHRIPRRRILYGISVTVRYITLSNFFPALLNPVRYFNVFIYSPIGVFD